MIQNEEPYKMRGRRVPAMDQQEIALFAKSFLRLIGINVSNRHELLDKIENLYGLDQFPLVVDLVDDEEWKRCYYGIAEGLFEPAHLQISLPNSTYEDAHRWELSAVRTFLHEVGHCFLAHGKYLNYNAAGEPKEIEDTEFQADCFADEILRILKIKKDDKQMSLF